jgi:hypothetical protein
MLHTNIIYNSQLLCYSECSIKASPRIYIYVVSCRTRCVLSISYILLHTKMYMYETTISVHLRVCLVNSIVSYRHCTYKIIMCTSRSSPHEVQKKKKSNALYWCVAYLPSEASIIEHWTYTFHYQISYTFIK